MQKYFLTIDIGASSGRHILGAVGMDGKMTLEEIYRFDNGMKTVEGRKIWDVDALFHEIKEGMKQCVKLHKIPVSVGIDTWGVDFVLLDRNDQRISDAVGYRDNRTDGMDQEVYKIISEKDLYRKTGIQKAIYNTIYQLMALKVKEPELLKKADSMLLMPDYFHFLLTGRKATEYTNATTTQLIDPVSGEWNLELIQKLGYPKHIFQTIMPPGTFLGELTEEIQNEVGFNCKVILPGTHDTASAVAAVPASPEEHEIYISSGTWSLLGTERKHADCSEIAWKNNFTNEGGYDHRYRFLKNIMGMWLIQSVRAELAPEMSYAEICELASQETIKSVFDCMDDRFLAPEHMTKEIQDACRETKQQIPTGIAQTAAVIYRSLAQCYAREIANLEAITGIVYEKIYIVGGGSKAAFLNRLTEEITGKKVLAGPGEATAIGNMIVQMIAEKEFPDFKSARECVERSFTE